MRKNTFNSHSNIIARAKGRRVLCTGKTQRKLSGKATEEASEQATDRVVGA